MYVTCVVLWKSVVSAVRAYLLQGGLETGQLGLKVGGASVASLQLHKQRLVVHEGLVEARLEPILVPLQASLLL